MNVLAQVQWLGEQVKKKVEQENIKRLRILAKILVNDAKALCPIGTVLRSTGTGKSWAERKPGTLRKSIRYKLYTKSKNLYIVAGSYKAFYAKFVEFDTVKLRGRKFMRGARDKNISLIKQMYNVSWFV